MNQNKVSSEDSSTCSARFSIESSYKSLYSKRKHIDKLEEKFEKEKTDFVNIISKKFSELINLKWVTDLYAIPYQGIRQPLPHNINKAKIVNIQFKESLLSFEVKVNGTGINDFEFGTCIFRTGWMDMEEVVDYLNSK